MEDPQAIADLLADEADDDFTYEEVEVMRYVFRVFWRYLCVFLICAACACPGVLVRRTMTVPVKTWTQLCAA